ncbi:DUF1641 domain-containing protein [Heyndrickxia sp. NPDC080065]|uniref:DUF1641 domain-containing protein n=1 Tax=Heyndrickxia sp. NPDC080065 TaxID=3390568 RepID=UPI003D050BF7
MGKPIEKKKGNITTRPLPHNGNATLLHYQDELIEIGKIVKNLKDKNILTSMLELLSQTENLNKNQLNILKKGVSKGIESAVSSLEEEKDINTFQLMKMMKDPDINRSVSFFLAFFKGMGKSL